MWQLLKTEELRSLLKREIENFEIWGRRIIEEELVPMYGESWYKSDFLKNKFKERVESELKKSSFSGQSAVNALYIGDIVYILCHPKLYENSFKKIFHSGYKLDEEEMRNYLTQIEMVRNKLSHANPVSIREAEKVICYTHDFIDCLKDYYKKKGNEQMYNVPMIIKFMDSLGNEFSGKQISRNSTGRGFCHITNNILTEGDILNLEVEIDPSYNENSYKVEWLFNNERYSGKKLTKEITEKHIRINFYIFCHVISNEHEWHRCGDVDDSVTVVYQVVPGSKE